MDSKHPPNPPDCDNAPPPSYDESANTAYNPAFLRSPGGTLYPNVDQSASSTVNHATRETVVHVKHHEQQQHFVSAQSYQQGGGLYPAIPPPEAPQPHAPQYPQQHIHPPQMPYPHVPNTPYSYQQPLYSQTTHYQSITNSHPQRTNPFSFFLPPRATPRIPLDHPDRRFPIAALFFILGCVFPLMWVIGACWSTSRRRYEAWWGKVNFVMAFIFIVSFTILSVFTATAWSIGDWSILARFYHQISAE